MWWSLLTLSFIAVGVFASEVTLPVTLKFGDNEVTFSEDSDSVLYTVNSQDGSSVKSRFYVEGSGISKSDRVYSANDCSVDEESCVEFVMNDVSLILKNGINSRAGSTHALLNASVDDISIGICLELEDGVQWFGGSQAWVQEWPVQNVRWNYTAYIPKETDAVAIAEPYWVSSTGTYFYVNPASSLFIDQNNLYDGYLCIFAENVSPYRQRGYTSLEYWMADHGDPRSAHEAVVEKFFPKPTGIPDERMIAQPIWSTWARYKIHVNDSIVRIYANEILDNGFNHSQLEIDDYWETCYGSLTFSTGEDKFPDIKNLTDDLHNLGFRVTLWIHPFINVECEEYYEIAKSNGYFVQNENGSILTRWWQGENTSVIDFTNEAAVEWFTSRLTALRESAGIDSFKFDAGETSWAPQPAVLTGPIEQSPGIYTANYTRALAKFGSAIEVRTGWHTQDLPVFVRMPDKETSWTIDMGLPTLITTLLVMNIAGYGFVLPDMVGGNGYINHVTVSTQLPSKELFIRWLQANTFMPSIQYSFVPWDFDDETVEICHTYTDLHEKYAPTIIEVMNAAVVNGTPVNPPIWWLDPTNTDAYNISDEFLLGEVIVVAPVIEEGAVTRNIFLPKGTWLDASYGSYETYEGPIWIYDYPAPLNILPYFIESNYWNNLQGITEATSETVTEAVTEAGDDGSSFGVIPSSSLIVVFGSAILTIVTKLFLI